MYDNIDTTLEKIYIIQPITRENAGKYKVLQEEAVSLIESAGALYAGTIYQNVREINAATFVGEGKLQVELAQLKYIYPRLKGKGEALSRLGGGVGTRGPGETQLETDRRYIRGRIQYLENRLKETEKRRSLQTFRRKKTSVKTIALVGYTNTGKSTLMNLLTGADVYVKNELFATLDPTARKIEIEGIEFLLVDTVGFLQDLPHNLIESFKSTLESSLNCDLALIVCDATGEFDMQMQTTLDTLRDMDFNAPYLLVMNKSEGIADHTVLPYGSIAISAKENVGIPALKQAILREFREEFLFCELFVPYAQMHTYNANKPLIIERHSDFTDDGQTIDAVIPTRYADKFTNFIVKQRHI